MENVYVGQHLDLVADCKKGDRKAQYELYRLYSKAMYNVALRIVNDDEEAADVLQESFLDTFTRIADFRQETTFGLWLKHIVVNKSISRLRKRKLELISIDDAGDVPDNDPETDEDDVQFQVQKIHKGIQMLPDGYRIVLSLYLLEGYDHEEISHILKISENTSRTQFMRAKRRLLELLRYN